MAVSEEMKNLCRLCMSPNSELTEIFQEQESSYYSMKIMTCFSVEVHKTDPLPKKMCPPCVYQLEKFYMFRKGCRKTDTKYRAFLRKVKSKKIKRLDEMSDDDDEDEGGSEAADPISAEFVQQYEKKQIQDQVEAQLKDAIADARQKVEEQFRGTFKEQLQNERKQMQVQMDGKLKEKLGISRKTILQQVKRTLYQTIDNLADDGAEDQVESPSILLNMAADQVDLFRPQKPVNEVYTVTYHPSAITTTTPIVTPAKQQNLSTTPKRAIPIRPINKEPESSPTRGTAPKVEVKKELVTPNQTTRPVIVQSVKTTSIVPIPDISESEMDTDENDDDDEALSDDDDDDLVEEDEEEDDEDDVDENDPSRVVFIRTEDAEVVFDKNPVDDESCYEKDEAVIVKNGSVHDCKVCRRKFATQEKLQKHELNHRTEKNVCEDCGKCFSGKGALMRHKKIHMKEKPFRCDVCGKGFTQKGSLMRHVVTHQEEKPFSCDKCGRCFAQRFLLTDHVTKAHSDLAVTFLFSCTECPKTFRYSSGLSRHTLSHTGKPFQCPTCNRQLADYSSLQRHLRLVHKEEN